uniref:Uncharacterized protein n=1 Tax=Arundo donax TaxID=35708 RepID=A0A0A9AZC3_ARUDO
MRRRMTALLRRGRGWRRGHGGTEHSGVVTATWRTA